MTEKHRRELWELLSAMAAHVMHTNEDVVETCLGHDHADGTRSLYIRLRPRATPVRMPRRGDRLVQNKNGTLRVADGDIPVVATCLEEAGGNGLALVRLHRTDTVWRVRVVTQADEWNNVHVAGMRQMGAHEFAFSEREVAETIMLAMAELCK